MAVTTIKDVLSGKDARDFINFVNVKYSSDSLKDKIINSNPDDFLLITKTIGSAITITDVKNVDDNLINGMLGE